MSTSLSVVIPVLEPDAELSRCVSSILAASTSPFRIEIVIVAPAKCITILKEQYPFAHVCVESRIGIYSAMNDGALASHGDYLYFMGKDDILLPNLCPVLNILERKRPCMFIGNVYWGTRGIYSCNPSKYRLLFRNLCHQGIIYSREAFVRHGPYIRSMRVQADHFFNIKILWDPLMAGRIYYYQCPLAWYSGDGFSSVNKDPVFWRFYPIIMRRYVGSWAMYLVVLRRILRDFCNIKKIRQ